MKWRNSPGATPGSSLYYIKEIVSRNIGHIFLLLTCGTTWYDQRFGRKCVAKVEHRLQIRIIDISSVYFIRHAYFNTIICDFVPAEIGR